MEQRLWRETTQKLTHNPHSLHPLTTLHSLLTNPSTSPTTLTSILQTLTHLLSLPDPPDPTRPALFFSLLSTLSHLHHHHDNNQTLTQTLTLAISLLSDTAASPRLIAAAISSLISTSVADSIDDSLLVSLCFRPCVSVRVWFLKNVLGFGIRVSLLLPVLLGFTKDPFPIVRRLSTEGLVGICTSGVQIDDLAIVDGCFFRSVELLRDRDDCVRVSAIRAVIEWGRMVASYKQEGDMRDWSDAIFLQVCSLVRDMNVGVKVEAFTALGKIHFVSEDILLQTLSKKVLGTIKGKPLLAPCRERLFEIHASLAAGVFIHGLEDEYDEVQRAACVSLRMLAALSDRFAGEAVDILVYILNDDSILVRLEALKTLHHMVTSSCVKMREEHIDMLLGTLVDNSPLIRATSMKILGSVKLPGKQVFKMALESLLGNLDIYRANEPEIFRSLLSMGQNHGKYVVNIIKEYHHEIIPSVDVKIDLNSPKVAGLLVLTISASLKNEKYARLISPEIFSYAVTFIGRISHAFADILDEDSLHAYLSSCCQSEFRSRPKSLSASTHVLDSVKLIFAMTKNLWPSLKSGCTSEVLKALRGCKESLENVRSDLLEYTGALAFVLQHIHIMKLLAMIWAQFALDKPQHLLQMGEMGILLLKLDKALLASRYRFIGLSQEDELHILELFLLSYVLKLTSFHTSCTTLHKISDTLQRVDILRNANSIACSEFMNQLAELSAKGCFLESESSYDHLRLKKILDTFVPWDFSLTQNVRHIRAELKVPSFNSVSPLRFFSGLPVGIPLEITLYNVTSEHRIWIKMSLDGGLTEFVFLEVEQYEGVDEVKQCKFTAPFYRIPKATAFTLRVNIGMQCASEDLHLVKGHGGPKQTLTYLCPEKELYFVNMVS